MMYAVYANHENHRNFLGIASGDMQDIEAFYESRKAYGLDIEPIQVNHIPAGFAVEKAALKERRRVVAEQLAALDGQLKKHYGD